MKRPLLRSSHRVWLVLLLACFALAQCGDDSASTPLNPATDMGAASMDLATLKAAFDTPYRPEFTDDASVYEAAGHTVNLCEGDPWNVKVTTPEDLTIAEAFVRASRPKG